MDSIFFFVGLILLALYWYNSMQVKSFAVQYARIECQKANAQLLDQTVQRVKLSFSRDRNHNWHIWREYSFEYSTDGVNRQKGMLVVLGTRLVRSALETSNPMIH